MQSGALVVMLLVVFIVPSSIMPGFPALQPRVLILSSTQNQYPMQYVNDITSELKRVGYNVTFLSGSGISLNQLTVLFNQFDILIWRTSAYTLANTTYWYLGQELNDTALAPYRGANPSHTIDVANGMIAVSADFFVLNFSPSSLRHIKLAILSASMSITPATDFISAGVRATVDFYSILDAPSTEFDWVTWSIISYLTNGNSVSQSVQKTVYYYQYIGSLDSTYLPPISFLGNGNLQIAG